MNGIESIIQDQPGFHSPNSIAEYLPLLQAMVMESDSVRAPFQGMH